MVKFKVGDKVRYQHPFESDYNGAIGVVLEVKDNLEYHYKCEFKKIGDHKNLINEFSATYLVPHNSHIIRERLGVK